LAHNKCYLMRVGFESGAVVIQACRPLLSPIMSTPSSNVNSQ
jgi:hypothetical protein